MTGLTFKSIEDLAQYNEDAALIQDMLFKEISFHLRGQRLKKGLSVYQVSADTGLPVGVIDKAEEGRKNMRWGAVARLFRYYGGWFELKFIPLPVSMRNN